MPPAFALSQDQTLRFIMQTQHKPSDPQSEQQTQTTKTQTPANHRQNISINASSKDTPTNIPHPKPAKARIHTVTDPKTHNTQDTKPQPTQDTNQSPYLTAKEPASKQDAANISLPHQIQLSMNVFLSEAPVGRPVGGGGF